MREHLLGPWSENKKSYLMKYKDIWGDSGINTYEILVLNLLHFLGIMILWLCGEMSLFVNIQNYFWWNVKMSATYFQMA